MFLHSGASLHGHEYSRRTPQLYSASTAPIATTQGRKPLLRSALAPSSPPKRRKRVSIGPTVPYSETTPDQSLSPSPSSPTRSRARPVSEYIPRAAPDLTSSLVPVVRFKVPEHDDFDLRSKSSEGMSSYEGSVADLSDSETETDHAVPLAVSRSPRTKRASRKSTIFHLAQPAPKLRHKQRLLPTRPKLFLQMQRLSPDGRPRPAIDVYPSSAFAKTIVAPLLKRFPLVSRIKCELSIQDVLLVRSEDYSTRASDSESDSHEEDSIKSRDLVAVLSPLRTEDKAEIVLADGTVWVATPRRNGSYDFASVDANGNTITARWVRRPVISNRVSLPPTPTSIVPPSPRASYTPSSPDHKFTFSIIDPNHRRHPVMATLTSSSLEILDSYAMVSQSTSRRPPISPHPTTPPTEKAPQLVEEWQRNFISVSAIWVALRHGWAPNVKPSDLISPTALHSTPSKRDSNSHASQLDVLPKSPVKETFRALEPAILPKRATSTGAAYVHKRKAIVRTNTDIGTEADSTAEKGNCKATARRAFSGDWGLKWRSHQESSLAAVIRADPPEPGYFSNRTSMADVESGTTLTPIPILYTPPATPEPSPDARSRTVPAVVQKGVQLNPLVQPADERMGPEASRAKVRQHKWRDWFKKLGSGSR